MTVNYCVMLLYYTQQLTTLETRYGEVKHLEHTSTVVTSVVWQGPVRSHVGPDITHAVMTRRSRSETLVTLGTTQHPTSSPAMFLSDNLIG